MKKYAYNIRCKRCKIGFNPKDSKLAAQKICQKCLKVYKKELEKFKEEKEKN